MSVATTTMAGPPAGQSFPVPPAIRPEQTLSPGQWGMLSFLVSEVALFSTLIVTYLFYLGKDVVGPTPAEALSLGLVVCTTACLLASSATIHLAERRLERGNQAGFLRWWLATIVLGVGVPGGHGLRVARFDRPPPADHQPQPVRDDLLHPGRPPRLHVTAGVTVMLIVLGLALGRQVTSANRAGVELVSWYWHFVDGVWVVVFTVVYLVGR